MEKKAGLGGFTSGSLPHYLNRLHLKMSVFGNDDIVLISTELE